MELTVAERLSLMTAIPKEGDITMLRVVVDLQRDLGFSEEELALLKLRQEGGSILWEAQAAEVLGPKEVPMGRAAKRLIARTLRSLNAAKKLSVAHLSLYDKFVEEGEADEEEGDAE